MFLEAKMTIIQIEYFQKTAQLQHITRAADALRIAQPSLSASLQALERELEVPLFERSGRGILLTKQGTVFLEYANQILHDIANAKRVMSNLSHEHESLVRLGYIAPLGQQFVPQTLRLFLDTQADRHIRFLLESDTTRLLRDRLRQDAYDFILCSEIEGDPELEQIPMMDQPIVLITSPGHPLAMRADAASAGLARTAAGKNITDSPVVTLADTLNYPLISYQESSPMHTLIQRLFTLHDLRPDILYRAPDEQTIASLVAADFGIALVAQVERLEQMGVRILPLTDVTMARRIYLTSRRNRKLSATARHLMAFMLGQAPAEPCNGRRS